VPDLAYVNDRICMLQAASVPILDRGFLFADGVYEVMRTYEGRVFEPEAHLARLRASLAGLRLRLPVSSARLLAIVHDLLGRSRYPEARIYIQITRGVAPRQHAFPRRSAATLVVWVERLTLLDARKRARGATAITIADPRWARCDLKTIALLPNVLAKQAAVDAGVDEAILVGADDVVREASTANVFMVRDGILVTHPLGREILPGVSRQIVLELAPQIGLRVRQAKFDRRALYRADEVLLSSTTQEVLGVVRIDGRRIGQGRPGEAAQALWTAFQQRVHAGHGASMRRRGAASGGKR
jgi:D-alanine transaminase